LVSPRAVGGSVHVDLCGIRDLLAVDRELDALKAEAGALAVSVRDARAGLSTAEAALDDARAAQAAAVQHERRVNRELEDYTEKRDRTRRLIDTGGAPDFATATRQLEQLTEIVDSLESELLEQMDTREQAEEAEASAEQRRAQTRVVLDVARAAERDRRPGLEARYAELRSLRPGRWSSLRHDEQGHYTGLRERGLPILVDVVDGTCGHCHVEPPPQTVVEILRERRVHTCRSCHCWFRDVQESAGEE